MWKKIRVKIRILFYKSLVKLSMIARCPWLTAKALGLLAGRIDRGSKYTVLVIGRSIFYDDIEAMAKFSGKLNYVLIHLTYWDVIFKRLTAPEERKNLTEANYHVTHYGKQGKQRYYEYLKKMFPHLQKALGINAVISGNIGYIVQQELARVSEQAHVPFIVLHKEALVVSQFYETFLKIYQDRHFLGSKMLFYNSQCRDGFLKLNLPGLTPEKAVRVGIPRFDQYFLRQKKPGNLSQKQVVFFSFLPRTSLRFLELPEAVLKKIDERSLQFFQAAMRFAQKYPEIKVVIKTKAAHQYVDYPARIHKEYFKAGIRNLAITNTGDPSQLIADSLAVIGFNSTTLIEAIISGKLIISPYYGDIITDREWSFFERYPELVHYAKSLEDLEQSIFKDAPHFAYNREVKENFLDEYVSTKSGGASLRAEEAVIETIKNSAKI